MAIMAVALLIVGCISTTAFLLQMELIMSGGWCRATSKFIALASVMFTLTVTAVLMTWGLIFTQLTADVGVIVGFLFACVTVGVATALTSGMTGAMQKLSNSERQLRFKSPLER